MYKVFELEVEVHDEEQLVAAALKHLTDVDGLSEEEARDLIYPSDYVGLADINACLVALLDPGSLPGCSIEGSSAS